MDTVFTTEAVDQIRRIVEQTADKTDLRTLMESLEAPRRDIDSGRSTDTLRLASGPNGEVFVARSGDLRAVVTVDPNAPDRMVVASVFQAGEDEGARLGDAISGVVGSAGVGWR